MRVVSHPAAKMQYQLYALRRTEENTRTQLVFFCKELEKNPYPFPINTYVNAHRVYFRNESLESYFAAHQKNWPEVLFEIFSLYNFGMSIMWRDREISKSLERKKMLNRHFTI